MQTTEGEQIAQLIAGYIDIILKKVRSPGGVGGLGLGPMGAGEDCRPPLL